ncbi:CCA tRNA nucleotidyltransferase [Bacillaceae bacterium Marseille-Q3522]|nr:CCA tRNA nucleotidyltransferase [Bacillaceae bacterium Marseille-Q3522]
MLLVFLRAVPILEKLENAGFAAYFVGGAVRDYLLHKPIDDVDIATSATPMEVKGIFSKTIDVGIAHGTVVVLFQGFSYEVTTFRTEADYEDFRRPQEVHFVRSLEEDLQRRDFTINALAMNKEGKIIDLCHGTEALQAKRLETVGKAEERFSEDALRMLRAVRFVSQLAFSLEKETNQALINCSHLLQHIAVERKSAEFEKILNGTNRRKAIKLLTDTGLYCYLPSLEKYKDCLLRTALLPCEALTVNEMWALLLQLMELKHVEKANVLKNWKLSRKTINEILTISKWVTYRMRNSSWERTALYQAKRSGALSAEKIIHTMQRNRIDKAKIAEIAHQYEQLPIKSRAELAITGTDLLKWEGMKAGPWIKEQLSAVEKAIIEGVIENKRDKIKEWLECNQR